MFACVLFACACPSSARQLPGHVATAVTNIFNVRNYGALGDGHTLDTASIARTIHAASAAGGGTVLFPPGKYVIGTLELLSNVTLDLEAGSVLEGSANPADYGSTEGYGFGRNYGVDSTGEGFKVGMLVARNAQNLAIVGRGAIDGNGDSFFDLTKPHSPPDFDAKFTRQGSDFDNPKISVRFGPVELKPQGRPGTMIIFSNCRNILIRDVTLSNAPNWTLHLQGSEDAVITGLHIRNDLLLPNNDGIDCMGCKNVHISDCDIRAGDDDFAIVGSANIQVTNCSLTSYSAAIRLEDTSYSTFDNLSIHANRGIGVFGRGNEHTAHVLFSNITLETQLIPGHWWGKGEPIYIAATSESGEGDITDVRFTNITGDAESGILIYGSPVAPGKPYIVRNVTLDRIRLAIRAPQPEIAQSVGGNFDLRWTAKALSEAIFKHDIPALYARYISGLTIRDFELTWANTLPDYFSSAIECEDFRGLSVTGFEGRQAAAPSDSLAAIVLRRGTDVVIRNSRAVKNTGIFLSATDVSGERLFVNNDLSNARLAFAPGTPEFKLSGNQIP